MARARKVIVVVTAFVAVCHLQSHVFVAAPPSRKAMMVAPVAGFMALTAAAPALADEIDDAAEKLGTISWPLMKSIPWTASTYASLPGANPLQVLNVVDKCLIQGAAMDPSTLIKGVQEHSKAIASIDSSGLCSQQDYTYIIKAIGHMIASAGVEKSMDVYDAAKEIIPVTSGVPAYLMGTVSSNDAAASYRGLLDFSTVVLRAAKGFPH